MTQVYISAGSNHNRQQNIAMALARLKKQFGELLISPIYQSPAVNAQGDDYYNLAVGFETALPVAELRRHLRETENELGRDRSRPEQVTVDLDLLLYGQVSGRVDDAELPHPDLFRHRHVLQPLADIAGSMSLPGANQSLDSLLAQPRMRGQTLQPVTDHEHEL